MHDLNPYSPSPNREFKDEEVDSQMPLLFSRVRDVLAAIATLLTALVMLGGYDWRGGPPPTFEFVIMITISAVGFGFGFGAFRDPRSSTFLGLCCLAVCGSLLARGLFGLVQGNLRGFSW